MGTAAVLLDWGQAFPRFAGDEMLWSRKVKSPKSEGVNLV
jgi:hypothetical protein